MGLKNVDGFWFSWDDNKSERNWRIREFNLEAAIEVFFDEYAEFSGNMEWKGEERYQVIGNAAYRCDRGDFLGLVSRRHQ